MSALEDFIKANNKKDTKKSTTSAKSIISKATAGVKPQVTPITPTISPAKKAVSDMLSDVKPKQTTIPKTSAVENLGVGLTGELGKFIAGVAQLPVKTAKFIAEKTGMETKDLNAIDQFIENYKQKAFVDPSATAMETKSGQAGSIIGQTIPYLGNPYQAGTKLIPRLALSATRGFGVAKAQDMDNNGAIASGATELISDALLGGKGKILTKGKQFAKTVLSGYQTEVGMGIAGQRGEDRTGVKALIPGVKTESGNNLAFGSTGFSTVLGLLGLAGANKQKTAILNSLAREENPYNVGKILYNIEGVTIDTINKVAPDIARAKTVKEVEDIIANYSKSQPSGLRTDYEEVKKTYTDATPKQKQGGFVRIEADKGAGDNVVDNTVKNEINLIDEANKFSNGGDFYERSGSKVLSALREKDIRGKEQVTKYWEELTGKKSIDSYKMDHRPSKLGATGDDISKNEVIPKDIYDHPEWYANMKDKNYVESFNAIKAMRGKPDMEVTVYRASPKNELNDGDWITLSKSYAKQESLAENTPVNSFKVKAKDIQFAGDDINEFGYYPENKQSIKPKPETKPYKETGNLTTKILKDLEGKTTVSRQYILDSTNRQGISGSEVKIIKDVLAKTKGDVIEVAKFAEKVKKELIPLKVMTDRQRMMNDPNADEYFDYDTKRYENVSLPKETRGDVKNYKENVYQGKIKTNGSNSHFAESDKYMLHTRIEDMKDGVTRRVIEVQSDLYQKGGVESLKTNAQKELVKMEFDLASKKINLEQFSGDIATTKAEKRNKEVAKLEQYKNPTIHFRGVREEIKKAVDDGIKKLQFPTGETAMKIEGLGNRDFWFSKGSNLKTTTNMNTGDIISTDRDGVDAWVVTDVLGDGKFKAVPKNQTFPNETGYLSADLGYKPVPNNKNLVYKDQSVEQFDISGKVDTNNPIYKFYENDLAKYVKNNYDAKLVTDDKGVTWNEVTIKPEMGGPVTAFKRTQGNLNYSIKIKSSEVKKIIGEQLKGIVDPDNIEWVFDKKLIKQGILGRYSWNPRMESINPRLKPMIELYESWGKVSIGTAFHESYHHIETKIFSKEFVRKLDQMTLKHITKEDIKYYRGQGYKTTREILAEYRADAFATERLADGGFKKTKMQQVLELMDQALRKVILAVKRFVKYYQELPNKQGGFAKNPLAKKIEENLPEDLQRMKDLIEIKQDALDMNPMKKLAKYESKTYKGELPEVTGEKGKGKYNQKGDQMWAELTPESFTGGNLPDQADINEMYGKYVKQRESLTELKREYQKKRVEYYANKKEEVTKKDLAEKDEKALERILTSTARETEAIATKAVKQDEFQKVLAETQKRLADEKAYKELKAQKTREARTVSFKKDSYYQTIKNALKRSLKPVKLLDPKSKEIYKEWKTNLIITKELANLEASNFKSVPVKEGMQVINDYEAGKVTEYTKDIKTSFDSLRKEARDRGLDIGFRDNYIPHVYEQNAQEIKNAIANYMVDKGVEKYIIDDYMSGIHDLSPELASKLKLNPSFTKERTLPTYKVAQEYGLTPKYHNPAQLVAYYRQEMEKTLANRNLMKRLEEEVKILPSSIAPRGWKEIELPFGKERWYAKKDLADIINSEIGIRDVTEFGIMERGLYSTAKISKKMQEIALSAGVPWSNINFFSMGIAIKEITLGNFKAISPFIRANFNSRSIKYFQDNRNIIKDMAKQGLDISGRVGNFGDVYNTLTQKWNDKKYVELFGTTFDKMFNEKTFGSFMPQLTIQTFKDVQKKGLKQGMSKEEADRFAGNVVKNIMGVIEDVGRGKMTEDFISSVFFAPKFRESLINVYLDTARAGVDFISAIGGARRPLDKELYRNRRLIAGMIITYALYNYVNYKMNGHYMWENEDGRDFALKIPANNENGDIVYSEFLPSQSAFARNMISGTLALARGDFKTAGQKYGGLFSMPIKLVADVFANSDYFGREIFKESDDRLIKAKKISQYVGLAVNHPYLRELLKYIYDEEKTPLYQIASILVEAPFKFSTEEKVAQNQAYKASDKARIEIIKAKDDFMPTYKKIDTLLNDGKEEEAKDMLNKLTDREYEIFKTIEKSEKKVQSLKDEAKFTVKYNEIIKLKNSNEMQKAQALLDGLSDEEYKVFKKLETKYDKKTSAQYTAENNIIKLSYDYARAYATDPINAFKAMFTDELLGDVEGNLVQLKRYKDIKFTEAGGSEEQVERLLRQAGIPMSERSNYNLEHIVPVGAGGDTSEKNLYLENRSIHDSFTPVDVLAGKLIRANKLSRGEITKVMNRLKIEKIITPDEAIIELNNLAK